MKFAGVRVTPAASDSPARAPHPLPAPAPPPPAAATPRSPGFSPRLVSAPSVFLRISVFPAPRVPAPRLLPPPRLRPRSAGLETPRRSRGHNGAFHGFLHTLHHREGNTGVFLSSAHEEERGFDRGSYFFLIYSPEAPCSRPGGREQEPRNGFAGAEALPR